MDSDRIEGTLKEAEGKLTDDEPREAEGTVQRELGEAKDGARDAWDKAKEKARELADDVDDVV